MFDQIVSFIKTLYPDEVPVPLHAPRFGGNEKAFLADCIDSTFVSYLGEYVGRFETAVKEFTGAGHAVAIVNGTEALHLALILAGVAHGDEVITQPLTFVATANAIAYCGAAPVFVDVEKSTLGMNPEALETFLKKHAEMSRTGVCCNRTTGKKFAACVPMHTFGHPCRIERILEICRQYRIPVVEDSAEALGSFYKEKHAGTFGDLGILSFNGNKPVTTGGGGMILTNNEKLAQRARHLSTTAKQPHPWHFFHDETGYNIRMPNVNAAIGCAQMEQLPRFLADKRQTAGAYQEFFNRLDLPFVAEPAQARSNYWLNAVIFGSSQERDAFLAHANGNGVQARPVWTLMNRLPMYSQCQSGPLETAQWLEARVTNLPSSVKL